MPQSSKSHALSRCAKCGFGARFHRQPGAVVLLGRLLRWNGRLEWWCSICIGNLSPRLRRVWFERKSA